MAPIETNGKIIEITCLEVTPEEYTTAITMENLCLYLEGQIACLRLLANRAECISALYIGTGVIRIELKKAEAIGLFIIRFFQPETRPGE